MHEGQFMLERRHNGILQFCRPDGSTIEQVVDPIKAGQTDTSTPVTLPDADGDPWFGCGDTMDYAMAMHTLHCLDQTGRVAEA